MSRSPPVGQALGEGAPGLPDPSDADEDEIARAVEALYLGSGSAQDAWTSISERCRRIEWGRSYEAFASAFAGITRDRVADPIDFHVVGVDLRVFTDDYAEVHLEIERDGTRIELPSPRQYRLRRATGATTTVPSRPRTTARAGNRRPSRRSARRSAPTGAEHLPPRATTVR
jgi:hypothetical protein